MIWRRLLNPVGLASTVGLLILAVWLIWANLPENESANGNGGTEPDVFVENGRFRVFSAADGLADYDLTSPRSEYWQSRDSAIFEKPVLTLRQEDGGDAWTVRALNGDYVPGTATLTLKGEVRVQREPPAQPVLLETEQLVIEQTQRFIRSEAPIKITDASGVTTANQMKLWIDRKQVELREQVEGQYVIQKPARR